MRLKRVKIFGFKTFADRAEFSLDGGVIAVVGPNGCGKSNLVDAILWGLGEGNARHLRAASSQDVIFSGSAKRKPVGFAEVSLCFDNEDGALPIDASEVWITRRLTRSGDSDYSINRASCRQRDILELLADSGLGRAGYAIVGQKEIDQALSASADDRRAWIDEAAGVQRYRARKVESLRRLSQAQDHLQRVNDILRELESQREPMKEEAELALRYKSLVSSLREVEIGLLISELCTAVKDCRDLDLKIQDSVKLQREEQNRAEQFDIEVRKTGAKISEIEQEMDAIRAQQQALITTVERMDGAIRLAEQRLTSLDDLELSLKEDSESLQERLKTAAADLEAAEAENTQDQALFAQIQAEAAGVGEEARELARQLKEAENALADARNKHNKRLKAEAEQLARADRLKLAQRELEGVDAALPDLVEAVDLAKQDLDQVSSASTGNQSALAEAKAAISQVRDTGEADAQTVRRAMSERAALDGRRRGIEATLETHEGVSQGTRAVLEAVEKGHLQGSYIPVAEAIETDKETALAVETALGASANDLIVDQDSDAKRAIQYLKENRAGRATFQPISLMRVQDPSFELKKLLNEPGVLGRASELVRCQKRCRPVIDSLLGRVIVVEHLDVALKFAKTSGWSRMVTLEGEVVHASGAVTGGQQSRQSYGIVQRKADLAEIESQLEHLESVIGQFESRQAAREEQVTALEAEVARLQAEVKAAEGPVKEARDYFQTLLDELKSTERQKAKLDSEIGQIKSLAVDLGDPVDVEASESKRDEVLKLVAARTADAEQSEARLREARHRAAQAKDRWLAAQRRLEAAKEADSLRGKKLENLEPEREKTRANIRQLTQEKTEAQEKRTEVESKLGLLQQERRELLEQSLRQAEDAKAARENATTIGEANHQAELNRARAESRRANAAERLMDGYGLTEEDALAQEGVHEVPADAVQVVGRLRREIKSMGDVNVGAVEAYERLTERYDELSAQHEDILSGVKQVQASISELDKLTREKFVTTFYAVRDAFSETFTELFGGGGAELSLTDEQNVLESGVDISVQLPGKKKQPLQLLSGGERSLCASAFLFALLRVKPSPLVVLDEVDAPLDGRNVERFAGMLAKSSENIQFIVITHNPVTIEVAPIWLGVTMQDPGVSTLVPARLGDSKTVVREQSAITAQATLS